MRAQNKTPAAGQGHAGQDASRNSSLTVHLITVETLRAVMRDVSALHRAGVWPWAHERCLAALDEHRQHKLQRPIGVELAVDFWASDVAKLVGLDRDLVRTVAHGTLLDTPLAAIARELATCRAEMSRNSKRRAGK